MDVLVKRIIAILMVLAIIPMCVVSAEVDDAMQPTEPKPYAYWDLTGPDSAKKFWHDDRVTTKNGKSGIEFLCDEALGYDTIFGTNKDNLVFKTGSDYTIMVKYKVPDNKIGELQMVANATKEGKEAGVYCYRYATDEYNSTWRYSYNKKTGKFADWQGDFQYLETKDGYIVVSFHIYIPIGYDEVYLKFQTGESQKGTAFKMVVNELSIFTGYASLENEASVSTLKPVFRDTTVDASVAVLPSEPKLLEIFDFKNTELVKKFWYDSGVETTPFEGHYRAYKKIGSNFATLIGTSTAVMDLDYGCDYTLMFKYKNPNSIPVLQFVVNAGFDGEEKGLYVMRYNTSDFSSLMSYGYNYKRNKFDNGLADFQVISEDGYSVVAFHFYVPNGYEAPYFKFQTCEGQAPKEIDFQVEKISLFKGYAALSKMSDIDGKTPVMHIPEDPPGRLSFLEDVTIVIKDIIDKEEKNGESSLEYIFGGIWGLVFGLTCMVAGAVFFVFIVLRKRYKK